jgi:hypothetical protein
MDAPSGRQDTARPMTIARTELLLARSGPMGRRCALALLVALAAGMAAGLLAWGPVRLTPAEHHYADLRSWGELPNALNVLACLPLLAAAGWGVVTTWRSAWGDEVRFPWVGFHGFAALSALGSAIYHAAPTDGGYLAAHGATSGAFVMLTAGVLAERVHRGFGSWRGLAAAVLLIVVGTAWAAGGDGTQGGADLRPLLLLQVLPVLLIPAGAAWLPGAYTQPRDWLVMLATYGLAKLLDLADAALLAATGWLSGHTAMHLALAGVALWMAYRASASRRRQTSLNTAG